MILTWLYLMIAQLEMWIAAFLITHLTPVTDIVPVGFATAAVAISGFFSFINYFFPVGETMLPSLAIVLIVDGSILAYAVLKWGWSKIPGMN